MIDNRVPIDSVTAHVGCDVTFELVGRDNLEHLKEIQMLLFPITYPDSFYDELLYDSTKVSYLFKCFGEIIGVCSVNTEPKRFKSYLMTFGILPEYRRMRIGSQCLLILEIMLAKSYGIEKMYLHVLSSNIAAKFFYTRLGYHFLRIEDDYYRNLPVRSALLFVKNIK